MTNTKTPSFDLASLDTIAACNVPCEIEIQHPVTMEKTGIFISVVGKDSDVYRDRIKALANENLARDAARRGKQERPDIDKMEAKSIDVLVASTVAWRSANTPGQVMLDGDALDFSPDNAHKIYNRILPIREQVQEAINDLENFMRK